MRVLYLSRADEFRDTSSLVIIAKSMFKHMLDLDPEMFVTWVVPKGVRDEVLAEFVLSEMPDPRRMEFKKCMAGVGGRSLGYFLTEDVWYTLSQTKVDVPYDLVLSNQMAMTPIWHTVLANRYRASRFNVTTPIVNWQMWTATHQQLAEVPEYYAGEPDVVAESLSSLFATNVWESDVLYRAHLETMKQYLKPSVIRTIVENSVTMANGVDWPRLDAIARKREARLASGGEGALFWGGRLSNQKKPRTTFPLMAKVQAVTGCSVMVSTNRPESDEDCQWAMQQFPTWTIATGQNRTQFGEWMARGDVFLSNSVSESYGVAWLEMLATGMLGVFEKAWWNEALLPAWYPFVTDSHDQQVEMAVALLKQFPDGPLWKKYVPMVREWIEQEHNERKSADAMADLFRSIKARAVEEDRTEGTMPDLVRTAAEAAWDASPMDAPIAAELVWGKMADLSDSGREFGSKGDMVTPMYLRRVLEGQGWRDVCASRHVEVVPPGWTA